jgi:sugar phosphate isomerase/epimerase
MISRRNFGKLVLAGTPLSAARSTPADSTGNGVGLGVSTYSFRGLLRTPGRDNVDDIIRAIRQAGLSEIELSSANTEPAGPNSGPAVPPPPSVYPDPIKTPTPAEVAAAKLAVRNSLRDWRLRTPAAGHGAIREKFQAAGITIFAYRVDYDDSFTDEEIEVTFNQAGALGVTTIASLTTLSTARRLVPFAEKHAVMIALHNSANSKDPDAIATPQSFRTALAMSKRFRLNLDIGNFTAANFEPVAFLQENYSRVSHLQIKDRTRNGGANERFGEGDTPIKEVLSFVKQKQLAIPAFIEYEYIGLGTPELEVRKCLAYAKSALA